MWIPIERNWDRVQFEKLRKQVDKKFNDLHDELSDCYYNYWKKGENKSFRDYDVQSTPEESKALFDKLHGLIFHLRHIEFHQENSKQSLKDRIPEAKYDLIFDEIGIEIGKRSDEIIQRIAQLKTEGIELII